MPLLVNGQPFCFARQHLSINIQARNKSKCKKLKPMPFLVNGPSLCFARCTCQLTYMQEIKKMPMSLLSLYSRVQATLYLGLSACLSIPPSYISFSFLNLLAFLIIFFLHLQYFYHISYFFNILQCFKQSLIFLYIFTHCQRICIIVGQVMQLSLSWTLWSHVRDGT